VNGSADRVALAIAFATKPEELDPVNVMQHPAGRGKEGFGVRALQFPGVDGIGYEDEENAVSYGAEAQSTAQLIVGCRTKDFEQSSSQALFLVRR